MTDELPLHPPRYWRCQSADCGRKWHHLHMGKVIVTTARRKTDPTDLFMLAVDEEVPVREDGACPACGSPCVGEPGFVYGNAPPPPFEIKTADNAKWSYVE